MSHPTPAELLELHFGEAGPLRRARLAAHTRGCAACRSLLEDVAWAEQLLAAAPEQAPPADGLERVLARVAPGATAKVQRRPSAWAAALPSAAAVAGGASALAFGGLTAALVFFAAGSLVTLSLAPALILESQRRGGAPAAR